MQSTTGLGRKKEILVHSTSVTGMSNIPSCAPKRQLKLSISRELPLLQTYLLQPFPVPTNGTSVYLVNQSEHMSEPFLTLPFSHHPHQSHHQVLLIQSPQCVCLSSASFHLSCLHRGPGHQLSPGPPEVAPARSLCSFLPLHTPVSTAANMTFKSIHSGHFPGAPAAPRINCRVLTMATGLYVT